MAKYVQVIGYYSYLLEYACHMTLVIKIKFHNKSIVMNYTYFKEHSKIEAPSARARVGK